MCVAACCRRPRRVFRKIGEVEDTDVMGTIEGSESLTAGSAELGGSTGQFRLPHKIVRWISVGLIFTTAVVLYISFSSGVTLADLARIGYVTFGLAAAASAGRLLVQVARFRVVCRGLAGPQLDLRGSANARVASEFISLSTPGTSMGVFLRSAWLAMKGVKGGRALWIGYFEVLVEIYVGASLALVAGAYAYLSGSVAIWTSILLVAGALIGGATLALVILALRIVRLPSGIFRFAGRFIGEKRARHLEDVVQGGLQSFSLGALGIMGREHLPLFLKASGLTLVEDFLGGTALWFVVNAGGLHIDLFSSMVAVYGVFAVAQIPVTVGGAGIAELAMASYLAAVYKFTSWPSVILWRTASYQVLLIVSGVAFIWFLRKAFKPPQPKTKLEGQTHPTS